MSAPTLHRPARPPFLVSAFLMAAAAGAGAAAHGAQGNPLEDISVTERVGFVRPGGRIVEGGGRR